MFSLKFLVGLLALFGVLSSFGSVSVSAHEIMHWSELPDCGRLCINFAGSDGTVPGGCRPMNITCLCTDGLWRGVFNDCVDKGDMSKRMPGCKDESTELKMDVLEYVWQVYCPTRNHTKVFPSSARSTMSSSSVTQASNTTAPTSMASTSNASITTSASSESVDVPMSTSYFSTETSTIVESPSFVQNAPPSATATTTSNSALSITYEGYTFGMGILLGAMLVMVG